MQLMTNIAIIINIITIIFFSAAEVFIFKPDTQPKIKAKYAVFMGVDLGIYVTSLFVILVLGVLNGEYKYTILLLWIAAPFVLGHFAQYKTLKLYAMLQILAFCLSLVLLFLI